MATSRRQPRPETDNEALRAKLATMTYSFAQQLPQLSSHTPPPPPHNPQQTPADDPNFPKLTSKPVYSQTNRTGQTPTRAWDSVKRPATPGRPPKWANGTGKPTTAAEVVASVSSDTSAQIEETSETQKEEAELALYSKLVPTTSAVPRNPGSSLGGGGLRATGSVAAQKGSRSSTSTPLHAPQALPSFVRKEPMTSRMRSLSSDASKPQLARRVAKLNRSASATPPPTMSVPSSASSSASVDGMETETTLDEELEKPGVPTMTSFLRRDDLSRSRSESREDSPLSAQQVLHSGTLRGRIESLEPKPSINPPRRLDEAFHSRRRNDSATVTGNGNGRKLSSATSRRTSIMPSSQGIRSGNERELYENGVTRIGKEISQTNVPPGFEGRTATGSRSSYVLSRNDRSEGDSSTPVRSFDRGNPPVRPQNARADALREALDSRRRSGSPRNPRNPRVSNGERPLRPGGPEQSFAGSNGSRNRSERDTRRAATTGPDSTRRQQSSYSYLMDSRVNGLDTTQLRRSDAGKTVRNGEVADRRGTSSSLGQRMSSLSQQKSTGFGSDLSPSRLSYSLSASAEVDTAPSVGVTNEPPRPYVHATKNLGRLHDGRDEKVSTSTSRLQPQSPAAYQNGGSHTYALEQNGELRSNGNKVVVNGRVRQHVMNSLHENSGNDISRVAHSSRFATSTQNASTSTGAMMDTVRGLLGGSGDPASRGHLDGMDDVVLPPLPKSEDVAFESILRSMGWTPLDEDDGPKNYQNQTSLNAAQNEAKGSYHGNGFHRQTRGIDNANSSNARNGYYSHFH